MSTLETAISSKRWELAAHVLVLAALQTLNDRGPVLSPSTRLGTRLPKGGNPANGKKARRRKSHNSHP